MGMRRRARERIIQALYYLDTVKGDKTKGITLFDTHYPEQNPEVRAYFSRTAQGVVSHLEEIDALIKKFAKNWKLSRMAPVDRNILRLSVFEMLYVDDVPPTVAINEAVELGKAFGSSESGAFVNGILDSIREHLQKEGKL